MLLTSRAFPRLRLIMSLELLLIVEGGGNPRDAILGHFLLTTVPHLNRERSRGLVRCEASRSSGVEDLGHLEPCSG